MRYTSKFYLACSLLCFPLSGTVHAEQIPTEDPGMPDEDIIFQDIGSVFSASKFDQKITEAPSRVSIITAEEIRLYGYRTLEDVFKSLPGFYSTNDRNYSYSGVRGFSSPGDYDTKILMLLDGHRLNNNVYQSVYTDHAFILDLDLIDRIEVVRGPGSALYGSNAFFGVINIITRSGRALQGGEISGSIGSYDAYHGRVSYGSRHANGVETLLSGTYYDSEGKSRLYYPEFDSPQTNYGIAQDVDDTNSGSLFAKISFRDFILTGALVEMEKGIPTASYQTLFNDSRNRTWDNQSYLDLSYQSSLSDTVKLSGRIAYDWSWYKGEYVYDYGPPPDIVVNEDFGDGQWWTAEGFITWDFLENHRLIAGGEFRDSREQNQENYDTYGFYLDEESDIDTWGLFLQDTFSASEWISFNMGLRYDEYTNAGDTINPRLAAIFAPSDATSLKILYGTAFRAPNVYELFYDDDGLSQKANDSLQPETISSYEFVAEHQFNRNIRTSASVFYNDIDDLIVLVTDPADELLLFENLGSARARGLEVDLNGRWAGGWGAALSYTFQDAEDGNGNWLVNSPRHMAKLNFTFPVLPEGLLSGGLELQYMSERRTLGNNETGGSFVTNLVLLRRNLIDGMAVSLSVYNLFDEEYYHPVSAAHEQDSVEQQDRTLRLKIDYHF
jgi:iron complex outermembrane receptor protein